MGQDGCNGTPFEAVGSILTSNPPLPYSKISKNYDKFKKKKKKKKTFYKKNIIKKKKIITIYYKKYHLMHNKIYINSMIQ